MGSSDFPASFLQDHVGSGGRNVRPGIQQKCLILDEDLPYVWSTIINSMSQMPYDAVKYKSKSNNNSLVETSTLHDSTNTTTALSLTNTKENEPEQQYPMTL